MIIEIKKVFYRLVIIYLLSNMYSRSDIGIYIFIVSINYVISIRKYSHANHSLRIRNLIVKIDPKVNSSRVDRFNSID